MTTFDMLPGLGPEAFDRRIMWSIATNKPDELKKWQPERANDPKVAPVPRVKK